MAMSPSSKSTGRTPPFVFVALVLVVIILGYNYWRMSSSNRQLHDMNDKLALETKDTSEKRISVEKNLESAREELRVMKGNLDQVKTSLETQKKELNTLRDEHTKITDEFNKCKDSVAKCDTELQTQKSNAENLAAEKAKLESAPKQCSVDDCLIPVRNVVLISSKLVGTEKMANALKEGSLNADKLMEGIEKIEAPVKKEVKVEKVMDLDTDIPNNSFLLLANTTLKNATENLVFVSDKMAAANRGKSETDKERVNPINKESSIEKTTEVKNSSAPILPTSARRENFQTTLAPIRLLNEVQQQQQQQPKPNQQQEQPK